MRRAAAAPAASFRLVRAGAELLRKSGIESPRLDAEILLAWVIGRPRLDLVVRPERRVARDARRRFASLVRARAAREPVAYLLGEKEFRSRSFRVDRRVLVPRPETEILAAAAIRWLEERKLPSPRVLDLGCGTGCLAISIALDVPGSTVVATDVSPGALEVARENVRRLAPGRVALRAGDLFDAVAGEAPFDLIVSNPPYVATSEIGEVDPEVLAHEPESAWLAGPDPVAFHRRIVAGSAPWLLPGGAIMMEAGSGAGGVLPLAESVHPGARTCILDDLGGRPRVVVIDMARPGRSR